MSNTANRIIKNSGYLYANMAFSMFVSLYSTRLILNALGVSDFGIFAIIGGAIGMLGFLNSALAQTTQRYINYADGAGAEGDKKKIYTVSVTLHLGMSLLMVIVFEIAYFFFFNGILNIPADRITSAKWIYQFMVASTALTILSVPYVSIMNAHENMRFYSILGALQTIMKLMVAFAVVKFCGDKLILYGILTTLMTFIVLIIQQLYCKRRYAECEYNYFKYYDKDLMKNMTSFAGWGLLGSSSSMLSQYGMGIALNAFGGTILNAAQGIASQISGQLMVFSRTMMMAVNPVIGKKAGTRDNKSLVEMSLMTSKMSYLILAFFAFPFIIEAPFIMRIWLKNVPLWAVLFFRFEISRALLDQLTISLDTAIRSEGHIKYYNIIRSFTFFMPLPITILVLYIGYAPYWYYIVWIFSWNILGGVIILRFAHTNCGMSYVDFFKELFNKSVLIALIVIVCGCIPIAFMQEGFLRLLVVSLFVEVVFISLTWMYGLNVREREIAISLIEKIKYKLKNN